MASPGCRRKAKAHPVGAYWMLLWRFAEHVGIFADFVFGTGLALFGEYLLGSGSETIEVLVSFDAGV